MEALCCLPVQEGSTRRGCRVALGGGTESTAELEREDGSWNAPEQLLLSTNGNPSRCGKAIGPQRMAH